MNRILVMLVVLALPCLSWAASADSTNSGRANSLRDGVWALQFAITDFVALDEFAGGVSMKWHMSDKGALRFGVDFRANSSESELDEVMFVGEQDGYAVGLSVIYQRYVNPSDDAIMYWGAGPIVRFESSSRTSRADSLSDTLEQDGHQVGATAIIGAEWFATRVISLHAEYSGSFSYFSNEATVVNVRAGFPDNVRIREDHGWSASTGGVRFGLSVYF